LDHELDELDFEKGFLVDLLAMIGERLVKLDSYIDPAHPEESWSFDPMEHLAGVGMVAAQRYLASVCKWMSVKKDEAFYGVQKRKGSPSQTSSTRSQTTGSISKMAMERYMNRLDERWSKSVSMLIHRIASPMLYTNAGISTCQD